MAENLSLKLKDEVFRETEEILKKVDQSRNAYINDAVDFYNQLMHRKILKNQLARESHAVYRSSLDVLQEFERLEHHSPV